MRTTSFAFGTLIALISCLTGVSCQLRKCWGPQNYCYSWGGTKAVCVDGYCYCSGQDYDYNTCLPDAYGCKIVMNSDAALAKPQYNQQYRTNYSCTPVSSSTQYEVHVLGVYEAEGIHRRPPVASDATVNIVSQRKSNRPIILVLGNYEPVNWILNIPAGITITKVILVAYYIDKSSVSGDVNQVKAIERKSYPAQWPRGIGSDSGGGDTVGLLKKVYNRFGVVTSFTGTYKANKWSLDVLSSPRGPSTGASTGPSTGQITPFTPVWPQSTPLKPVWSSQNTPSPTPVGSEIIQELTKLLRQLIEEQHSQEKRITALERLEKNRTSQFQAQFSACVSAYKTGDKLSGFMIVTIMITVIQYAW